MNIFLINESAYVSAVLLTKHDPVRARKQLLECCQMLASVDYIWHNDTKMLKKDGTPYGAAHRHHPCVKVASTSAAQYRMLLDLAMQLAFMHPDHACSNSLRLWMLTRRPRHQNPYLAWPGEMVVVRKGTMPVFVETREQYAPMMLDYMRKTKGFPA